MATRNKRKCRNCPGGEPQPKDRSNPTGAPVVLALTSNGEGDRLWRHVLIGASTCLNMMEQYAGANMPGDPVADLEGLRNRLDNLISKLKGTANEAASSAERLPQSGPVDLSVGQVGDDADA